MNGEMIDKRTRIGEIIYIVYFTIMMAARAIGMYEGMRAYSIVFALAMLLFVCKMIITPHTVREYIIAVMLMALAIVVYLHTGELGLVVCFATMLGMKGVDKVRTLGYGAVAAAVCISGRMVTGVFGLMPERYWPQIRRGAGLMFRHALGYAHPNTLHMNVLMLSMLGIYLLTAKLSAARETTHGSLEDGLERPDVPLGDSRTQSVYGILYLTIASIAVFLFNLYVFQYSGSRTGLLATTAYLIVNLWFYLRRTPGVFEKIVCYASFPFVCFLAIVLPFIVPDSIFEFVDRTFFTTRFTIARYFWSNNSISLWGIRLANSDPQYRTYGIDMAQLYLFLQLGIAAFAVISAITMLFIHEGLKRARMPELAVLMGVLFAGIWEPFLYNLGFKNFMYVFMGALMYEIISPASRPIRESRFTPGKDGLIRVVCSIVLGVVLGCVASSTYLVLTDPPHALYADREQDEAGESFGMEPMYLSVDEAAELKDQGELIVGYVDENTPMYMYDESIAVLEYHKRVLSIGVWTGIAVMLLAMGCMTYTGSITKPEDVI